MAEGQDGTALTASESPRFFCSHRREAERQDRDDNNRFAAIVIVTHDKTSFLVLLSMTITSTIDDYIYDIVVVVIVMIITSTITIPTPEGPLGKPSRSDWWNMSSDAWGY